MRSARGLMANVVACCALLVIALPVDAQTRVFARADLQAAVDALDVVDLQGRRWTARDLRGRVTLIDFWATWCAPCLAELPNLSKLRQAHGPERFEVLGLSVDTTSRRNFVSWVNRQRIAWPQVQDGRGMNGRAAAAFGVQAVPASLLVGPDGRIAAVNVRGEALERAVARLVQWTATSSFEAARMPMVMR